MRIERRNTTDGQSPYAAIDFRLTTSEIRNPNGSVVFRLENVEVPEFWSQVASDVLAQKYFRKAGVAARLKKVEEESVPSWLWDPRRRDGRLGRLHALGGGAGVAAGAGRRLRHVHRARHPRRLPLGVRAARARGGAARRLRGRRRR